MPMILVLTLWSLEPEETIVADIVLIGGVVFLSLFQDVQDFSNLHISVLNVYLLIFFLINWSIICTILYFILFTN